jgi:hypothetical protein
MFHLYDFEHATNNYTSRSFLIFCIIGGMSISPRMKNNPSFLLALLLAAGLGWLLYRFVKADTISLKDSPPPKPAIVSRAEWGARPLNLEAPEEFGLFDPKTNPEGVLYYSSDLSAVLNTIVVHHSAIPDTGPADIQNLHMDRRGFADVAYHFMIAKDGMIYEGRELNIRGAHVQGFNTGSVGVVLLGNFNDEQPTEAQLNSLRALVDYLRYTYGIRYLAGHKDYPDQSPDGTECPGDNLYPLLPGLARELGMKYGIDGYVRPDKSNH